MSTLEVRELTVRAAGAALRRADVSAGTGELVLLAGDAGASTLLRTAGGVVVPAAGSVRVDGDDTTRLPYADVAARGVALVPAGWAAFGALTVRENVLAAARGDLARADEVLAGVPLPGARLAGALGAAEVRLLAVAVALARGPRLMLVDGLGGDAALAVLRAACDRGLAAVVAERAAFDGRVPLLPGWLEPGTFDGVYGVRGGLVRPWQPPAS
jgi:ABC-type branched-subunit amino acid transport system ATPase component